MAVREYKDKNGEIVPRKFIIEYYPQGRAGGQKREIYSDLSRAEAQKIYLQLRRGSGQPVGFDPPIKDIAVDWMKSYSLDLADGSIKDIEWALVSILKHLGDQRLSSLTLPLFESYMKKRRATLWRPPITGKKDPNKVYKEGKPISKSRINTELKYINIMLKWAIKQQYMLPLTFEMPRFKKLPKKAVVTPLPDAINDLLGHCDDKTKLVVMLYNDAGLRRTEGLQLSVENINLDENYTKWLKDKKGEEPIDDSYILVRGKGDKERIVFISSERLHLALAARIEKVKTGFLYVNPKTELPYKDLKKQIQSAAEKAGLPDGMYNHLLRHAHATNSLESGMDLESLREDLGHGSIATTQRYLHSRLGHRKKQTAKLKAHIGK